MPRTPDRTEPKQSLHMHITCATYESVRSLLRAESVKFRSFSQLAETLIFWAQGMHGGVAADEFLDSLARLKADAIVRCDDYTRKPQVRHAHVMVDPQAQCFLERFTRGYPALFDTHNAALELIFSLAASTHEAGPAYFERRMAEVMRQHP